MTQKPDSVEPDRTDFDALLREVVKDEILKDARPTLESLKALHADRPLLVVALSQAIGALTERDALLREVEAGKAERESVNERLSWILTACKIDRDAMQEIRELLP